MTETKRNPRVMIRHDQDYNYVEFYNNEYPQKYPRREFRIRQNYIEMMQFIISGAKRAGCTIDVSYISEWVLPIIIIY